MRALRIFSSLESAWLGTLDVVHGQPGGRLHHVIVAIDRPGAPDPAVVALNDALVYQHGRHGVARVASTVFPSSSYAAPALRYRPGMPTQELAVLDAAAADLYDRYRQMLPWLQTYRQRTRHLFRTPGVLAGQKRHRLQPTRGAGPSVTGLSR